MTRIILLEFAAMMAVGGILDCGGKRSATTLSGRPTIFASVICPRASESAVAAALCRRSPNAFA